MQIGPHRSRDANPAYRKARQPHEHQKRTQPFDKLRHARRAVACIGPPHTCVFENHPRIALQSGKVGAFRQVEPVFAVKQRAGGEQPRALQSVPLQQGPGAKGKAAGR